MNRYEYAPPPTTSDEELAAEIPSQTREILSRRRGMPARHRRGWLVRRMLLAADLVGLSIAFVVAQELFERGGGRLNEVGRWPEYLVFFLSLPLWAVGAKFFGLYDRDEERTDHSTADELARVFLLITAGSFLFSRVSIFTDLVDPDLTKLTVFWVAAIVLVTGGRIAARTIARRTRAYVQNSVILGAGDTGQLIARKIRQHPEYGINLVGLVDSEPKELRRDLDNLPVLGPPERVPEIVRAFNVERVIVSFSNETEEEMLGLIQTLRDLDVQLDIVPRLYEALSPRLAVHAVEGLPLIGLPPARISRSDRLIKRAVDVVGASIALVLTAPLFALIALRVRLDSEGPVFFRQTRLGENMIEFTVLKFRTMKVGTSHEAHRALIQATMDVKALPQANGLYGKLDASDSTTKAGRWLRRTSLDELPQLINVLRGEMSLVGPRPSLPYEKEFFAPHHFERFALPPGLTGFWQVTARSRSTWAEALDMDVAYVRGWSLSLDLALLCRTPLTLLRQKGTTS